MIRRYVLLIFILLSLNTYAQKVIQMENANGVYNISCSVNGAKMKMIFDTGASSVSLSETMANFLYDNGYISLEDVVGRGTTQTADGAIHNNFIINIRDLEISGLHLKDVKAIVIGSQNAPLLLGQSAIQKLGRISLNGDKLIITDFEGDYSMIELTEIYIKANTFYFNGSYYASIDNWLKLMDYKELDTSDYFVLLDCFFQTDQYDKCIKYGKEWEVRKKNESPSNYTTAILGMIATSLSIGENKKREAIAYHERCASLESQLNEKPYNSYFQIAINYLQLNEYDYSINYSKKAIKELFNIYNVTENQISTNGINNKDIGKCLYVYAEALYGKNDRTTGDYIMGLSANCNYEDAIEYCYKHNIKYKSRQNLFE